jgi:hypothetical protein
MPDLLVACLKLLASGKECQRDFWIRIDTSERTVTFTSKHVT